MKLKYPFVTEKAMMMMERDHTLQFLVNRDATKGEISRRSRRPLTRR